MWRGPSDGPPVGWVKISLVAAENPNHLNPYMFTGRRFDIETGLYYFRSRYYNPYIGRFMQTDPAGYDADMNLYRYCMNNPLVFVDPTGTLTVSFPSVIIDPNAFVPNEFDDPFYDPCNLDFSYQWEAPKQPGRTICLAVRIAATPIFLGRAAAIACEAGWCNVMLSRCAVWCETSREVHDLDREECKKKCSIEHVFCLARSKSGRCQMKFRISG